MRFLFLFLFFISLAANAQRSIGREAFMVNVRPVLNGILSDFYQMIVLFPEFPKEMIPIVQELDTLTSDKELLLVNCPRLITIKCHTSITSLRNKLNKIKSLSMNLMVNQKISSTLNLGSLSGLRLSNEFDNELESTKGLLDNTSFLLSAKISQKKETYFILKELDKLNTLISLSIVEHIPSFYKDDFKHFYFNFIHPVQQQISKSKNYEYINRNIKQLNFSLNLLNMSLTKRKKTPSGMAPFLATMHNRWNSLLRYYF